MFRSIPAWSNTSHVTIGDTVRPGSNTTHSQWKGQGKAGNTYLLGGR